MSQFEQHESTAHICGVQVRFVFAERSDPRIPAFVRNVLKSSYNNRRGSK